VSISSHTRPGSTRRRQMWVPPTAVTPHVKHQPLAMEHRQGPEVGGRRSSSATRSPRRAALTQAPRCEYMTPLAGPSCPSVVDGEHLLLVASQLSTGAGEPPRGKSRTGHPARVSSTRTTRTPERSSGFTSGSSSASTKRNRAPEWPRDVADLVGAEPRVDGDENAAGGGDAVSAPRASRGCSGRGTRPVVLGEARQAQRRRQAIRRASNSRYVYRRAPWTTATLSGNTYALRVRKLTGESSVR